MKTDGLAMHETLELQDLVLFRNLCCTKTATMHALVSDERLKQIMINDVQTTKEHLQELQGLLTKSNHH